MTYVAFIVIASNTAYAQNSGTESGTICEAPIYGDGSALIIPVTDGKTNYLFFVDTGSARTFFDASTFRSRTRPFHNEQIDSDKRPQDTERVENPGTLRVAGHFPIRDNPLYLADLSLMSEAFGAKLNGVLGCDFLNHYTFEVDADAGILRITQDKSPKKGQCIEFGRDKLNRPAIKARIEGSSSEMPEVEFLIDSGRVGFGGVVLTKNLFQSCVDSGLLTVEGASQVTQSVGVTSERFGTLRKFRVWESHDNIRVTEKAGPQFNLLTLSYLMQYNFTFDFPNSKLYLLPRKTKNNLLQMRDLSGMGVLRPETEVVVRRIYPQSPASDADIRDGDIVLSVDGVATKKLRLFTLRASLCEEGKIVQLKMRRGTRQWDVDLKLADWRQKPVTAKDFE